MSSGVLGFCTKCCRVRWLARVESTDYKGNAYGICRFCARERPL